MTRTGTAAAWAQLLRVSALFTVPGDALAGAAAAGPRPGRRTALAAAASLCLYSAGMALNDWADQQEDAAQRPERPIPSGRIAPGAALAAATALTAAGLALAHRAGRPAAVTATALAATVWAYDLGLKHTPAGPAAMAGARALDLLLGAAASAPPATAPTALRRALGPAAVLGGHTYAVTAVSRSETTGGHPATTAAALAATTALAAWLTRPHPTTGTAPAAVGIVLAGRYLGTAGVPLLHAALNPSPPLTRRAVGQGIGALIPLQAALAARAGAGPSALALLALAPAARRLARTVSPT